MSRCVARAVSPRRNIVRRQYCELSTAFPNLQDSEERKELNATLHGKDRFARRESDG